MNKAFLLTAALAATCSAFAGPLSLEMPVTRQNVVLGQKSQIKNTKTDTRAGGAIDFSYGYEVYNAFYIDEGVTPGTTRVFLAFQMLADDIKNFAGNQVTGFSVYSPTNRNMTSNSITDARFFYSYDLEKEAYSQDFNMSKTAFGLNEINMDTPYTITGEEESLYFGYSFVVPKSNNMYYVMVDGYANEPSTGLCGKSDDESFPSEFDSFAPDYGALSMSIKIEGNNIPQYAAFVTVPSSICLPLDKDIDIPVTVAAVSGEPIESIEIEYTLGGNPYTSTCNYSTPVPAGYGVYFTSSINFPAQSEKLKENVAFKISKINGNPNEIEAYVQSEVIVVSEVPVHQTLYEEYTGTWCGYCTRGYAALEYIRKNYPDFVVAAYHSGTSNGGQLVKDPMQITNNFPSYVSGFPSAVLNRGEVIDPYYGTQQYMDFELPVVGDVLALNAIPTPWKISVSHAWESDDILVAKAEVANMAGYEDKTYKLVYLLVADGLTGTTRDWFQTNYYNTEVPKYIPELNAFCRGGEYGKASVAGLEFNDVVVSTTGIYGVNGSIPTSLESEQSVDHSISFDLSEISSDIIIDKNKLRVIAAVVDPAGNVLNCAKDEVNDFGAGVDGILDEDSPVEYYNLNGQKVLNPDNGIFIRRQGSVATKIIR